MANTASAKKDARQSAARALRNRSVRSAVKTRVTKFRRAVGEGGEGVAEFALTAVSSLDRAVTKGVLHRNNASRRKSRLMKRLNAIATGQVAAPPPAPAKTSKTSKTSTSSRAKTAAKR